jgi:alkane 1-monooxygenase
LFGAWVLANAPLSLIGAAGWVLSIGLVGGVTAINTAHELIHKPGRLERWAGGALLASVGYGSFRVEHIHGHHVDVATAADLSSARLGETIYRFVPRSIWRNPQRALELERAACAQRGVPWRPLTSELAGWTALSALFALACMAVTALSPPTSPAASDAAAAWWPGLVYFLGQGLVAISLLEIINYIEHYGLERRLLTAGPMASRYERVNVTHSWNANFLFTNLLLFQLQRHSDHHAHAVRRYQALRHFDESPQLPAGYSALVVLAAVPPLWRRVMDPRVAAYRGLATDVSAGPQPGR